MKVVYPVISYEGPTIIVDTNQMVIGECYPCAYRGKPAVVVKRADGSVDFLKAASPEPTAP